MIDTLSRAATKRQGQVIVEFAVASIIFFLLIFGMLQYFLILQNLATLEAGARFAIQEAAKYKFPEQQSRAQEAAKEVLESYLSSIGFIKDVDKVNSEVSVEGVEEIMGRIRITRIRMDVSYDMNLIFPLPTLRSGLARKMRLTASAKSISEYIEEI